MKFFGVVASFWCVLDTALMRFRYGLTGLTSLKGLISLGEFLMNFDRFDDRLDEFVACLESAWLTSGRWWCGEVLMLKKHSVNIDRLKR